MRSLLRLKVYFSRYRGTLLWGIFFILLSTVFGVVTPVIIRDAIDGGITMVKGTPALSGSRNCGLHRLSGSSVQSVTLCFGAFSATGLSSGRDGKTQALLTSST